MRSTSATEKREKAIFLRTQGMSYSEIAKSVGSVPKSTLSYWCKDIRMSLAAERRLKSNATRGFEKGLSRFNKQRSQRIKEENITVMKYSQAEISVLSPKMLMLVGAALYWGEGYKRQPKDLTPYVSFGNTDPSMVKIFMRFLRETLSVPENKIRAKIQIHTNVNSERAISFWNKVTGIPRERLRITHQVSKASKGKRPGNRQPYGTVEVIVSSRRDFFRIVGLIKGLSSQA